MLKELAQREMNCGKYQSAIDTYQQAIELIKLNSNWAKGHLRQGQTLSELHRDIAALTSATGLEPTNASLASDLCSVSRSHAEHVGFTGTYSRSHKNKTIFSISSSV